MKDTLQQYFDTFLVEYGITTEQLYVQVLANEDQTAPKAMPYFAKSNDIRFEGIRILYPDLDGSVYTYQKASKSNSNPEAIFYRIRLMNPKTSPDGGVQKYYQEKGSGWFPFWTKPCLEAFKNKAKVKTLFLTEGEKKAFRLAMQGVHCIGLPSKDGYIAGKGEKTLHHDILRFIKECNVENIVLLLDADTLAIKPEHLADGTDLYKRAFSFYTTAKNFLIATEEAMKEVDTVLKKSFFMHQSATLLDKAKGVDDLLNYQNIDTEDVIKDLMSLHKAKEYFSGFQLSTVADGFIKKYFGVYHYGKKREELDEFYKIYGASIQKQNFVYLGHSYEFNAEMGRYDDATEGSELGNGVITYYLKEYVIKSFSGKNNYATIAENFLIFIKYLTLDEREKNTWLLEIRQPEKDNLYLEVSHDDFHETKKMEKIFSAKRLPLSVTDTQLKELRNFLISKTKFNDALKILRYGFHEETELFFFGNCAITKTGDILYPDTYGIINYNNFHLSMPQVGKGKQPLYFYTENSITFNEWYSLFSKAQRPEMTFIATCWLLNTIFRDIPIGISMLGFSPILFITGIAGTAKSTIFRYMNYWFAPDIKELEMNIKGKNTNPAFTAKLEQRHNGYLFCDEYYPDHPLEDAFQASYDNKAYSKMDMGKGGLETLDLYPKSAVGIASNFKPRLPQSEPLFTRMVLLTNNIRKFTDERKKAHTEMQKMQNKGLSCLLKEVWQFRDFLKENYMKGYFKLLKKMEGSLKEKEIPSRLLSNLAVTMTPAFLLHQAGYITVCEHVDENDILDHFVEQAKHSIMTSWRMMADKSTLREFFEILQDLYEKGVIMEGIHFRFLAKEPNFILLNTRKLYYKYSDEYKRMNRFELLPPNRNDLEDEIMTFAGFETTDEDARSKFFTKQRMLNEERPDEESGEYGCCKVNYTDIMEKFGVDFLIRRNKKE